TYTVPYSAAKHAVVALSLALRAEATQLGVKVSVACPGAVRSNIDQTSHVVNSRRDVMEKFLQQGMATNNAARIILDGVARNRANIVFPGSLRFMWWLARFSPTLWRWLSLLHIRVLRTKVRMPTQPMASR
ncbi:MAG: SDR family NAD(P)-dependent oxidoreductase, partial [Chloroflexia bacterium]|nr:SDR family NAD(P)-dependent oxidoreductase [Chloroflexia bacterium]